MILKKYDVVQVDLNPPKGHVQAGIRPAIIVGSNLFNERSSTVLIVPLTSKIQRHFPSEFLIKASAKNGLLDESRFLGSQIILIDKTFIKKKLGTLEETYRPSIREALSLVLDPEDEF